MAFRASLCSLLLFLLCLVFVEAVKSRPLAGEDECAATEKYKCGEKPCNCREINPGLWSMVKYIFKHQSPANEEECDMCEILCERPSVVKCLNGVCHDKKCACLPCWKGKSCDQPDLLGRPKFEQQDYEVTIKPDATVGSDLLNVAAFDPCSKNSAANQITYTITHGNDKRLFAINKQSGAIRVAGSLDTSTDKAIKLKVVASKGEGADQLGVEANVRVTVKKESRRHRRSTHEHHVVRRDLGSATMSPSLELRISPVVTGNYTFYNKGDTINFRILCNHNASVTTKKPTSNLNFECSSQFLVPAPTLSDTGVASSAVTKTQDDKLTFTVLTLGDNDVFNSTGDWTVKTTIYPLANLYITCHVLSTEAGTQYKIPPTTSSPILYVVFPKVTLQRTTLSGQTILQLGSTPTYKMSIAMPQLDVNDFRVEVTTAINDDKHAMSVSAVSSNAESSITGANRQPTPTYHKSNAELTFNDRSVLVFGNLSVSSTSNNLIDITFTVTLIDHPNLANNSKLWVGAGMRSGYQMLWVGQEALYVLKEQPTVAVYINATNDTAATRYYQGDRLFLTFTLNHTETSTANAKDVKLTCYSTYVNFTFAEYVDGGTTTPMTTHNDTSLNTVTIADFPQGKTVTGSMGVVVNQKVNPLVELDVTCEVAYKNTAGDDKLTTKHKPSPGYVAGVPVFVLNKTTPGPHRIGSKVCFTASMMVRRMAIEPTVMEIIAPINGSAIFTIASISALTVGSNIENAATIQAKQFVMRSTVNDSECPDRATADLGSVRSFTGTTASPANEIKFDFCIVLNDHANITNASKHWVGLGVKGGARMMWIGEAAVVADVPVVRKPVLATYVTCTVPGTQQKCADTVLSKGSAVQYNITVCHDPAESQKHAVDIKVVLMKPPYVKYQQLIDKSSKLVFTVVNQANPTATLSSVFKFLGKLFFSVLTTIDPDNAIPPGNTNALSLVAVTYKATDAPDVLGGQLIEVPAKFLNPDPNVPTTAPSLPQEFYERGFFLDSATNTLYVCQHQPNSLKSSCYYTTDCKIWIKMDPQCGCIIGLKDGVLYALSKNKRAYIKQTSSDKPWEAITKEEWEAVKATAGTENVQKITSSMNESDAPSDHLTGLNSRKFGANKKGVFYMDTSDTSWSMAAKWSCCGN